MNWTSPGEFPPQSVHRDVRDSTTETDGRDLGSPPDKIFYACGRLGGDGELHIQAPQYGFAVYCDITYYQPLFGGGAEDGLAGPQYLVESGGV